MTRQMETRRFIAILAATLVLLGFLATWAGQAGAKENTGLKRITGRIVSIQSESWFYDTDETNLLTIRSGRKEYKVYATDDTVYGSELPRLGARVIADISPFKDGWFAGQIILMVR